jgi:predicted AAA+ superfamily ATPase
VLLRRMKKGHTDQSMIVVGLRGVGKTVLLSAFRGITEEKVISSPSKRRSPNPRTSVTG